VTTPTENTVTVHRSGGRSGLYLARIEQVKEMAQELVAEHVTGRMPPVRVVLTSGGGLDQVKTHVENELIDDGEGTLRRPALGMLDCLAWAIQPAPLGQTVLERAGAVILINGPKQKSLKDLDETLVHELVHCVQLNIPETKRQHITYVRQLYGVDQRTGEFGQYLNLAEKQEAEAYDLESLAKDLPPSPDGDDLDQGEDG
jgi:hypothetical protein